MTKNLVIYTYWTGHLLNKFPFILLGQRLGDYALGLCVLEIDQMPGLAYSKMQLQTLLQGLLA